MPEANPVLTSQTASADQPRVLIVEDDVSQRRVIGTLLRAEGFTTQAAETAAQALALAARRSFTVAVVDYRLPDATGIEVLRALLALQPALQVIIHTGFGSFDSAKDAVNAGAFGYVEKLGDPAELLQFVRQAAVQGEARAGELRPAPLAGPTAVWQAEPGPPFCFTHVSPEAEALLGYPPAHWMATPDFLATCLPPGEAAAAALHSFYQASLDGTAPRSHRLQLRPSAGPARWYHALVTPFTTVSGDRTLVGTLTPLTDATEAAGTQQALQAQQTRHASELHAAHQELEAFAYSVSHDLRAPLRAISGFAEIVARQNQGHLSPQGNHYIGNIVAASQQMDRLLNDLLAYARLGQKLKTEPVDVGQLLEQVRILLASLIDQAQATLSLPAPTEPIQSDRRLLQEILFHLIKNALEHGHTDRPPRVEVHCRIEPNDVWISVADEGPGIDGAYHEQVFALFHRLTPMTETSGTGLGLALVRKAAGLLGGHVWLASEAGAGTTVFVRLPRLVPVQAPPALA